MGRFARINLRFENFYQILVYKLFLDNLSSSNESFGRGNDKELFFASFAPGIESERVDRRHSINEKGNCGNAGSKNIFYFNNYFYFYLIAIYKTLYAYDK